MSTITGGLRTSLTKSSEISIKDKEKKNVNIIVLESHRST